SKMRLVFGASVVAAITRSSSARSYQPWHLEVSAIHDTTAAGCFTLISALRRRGEPETIRPMATDHVPIINPPISSSLNLFAPQVAKPTGVFGSRQSQHPR